MNISKSKWVFAMAAAFFTLFVSNPIMACHSGMKNCHCAKKSHCASSKKCQCAKTAKTT